MTDQSDPERASLWFVRVVLAMCGMLLVGIVAWLVIDPPPDGPTSGRASGPENLSAGSGGVVLGQQPPDPEESADNLLSRSAIAMGDTDSVEFWLERGGAPVWIDQFGSIALDELHGQFTVPSNAQATIEVTIDGDLRSRLGAIAYGDEVWLSNPVTGVFETLPPGYDIDPSRFFDPSGGWRPLIEHLEEATITERGDTWYRIEGVAQADDVANVTVGLVRDQDVPIELIVDSGTALVAEAHLVTSYDGADSTWDLTLDRYGASFDIRPPPAATEPTDATATESTDG